MKLSEQERIKSKILTTDPKKWWGDNYDIRFYLIFKLKEISGKTILDVGGGIGIICSELDKNNTRVNMDLSYSDLLACKNMDSQIQNICSSMISLPFKDNSFDIVICANVLEVAKAHDISTNKAENVGGIFVYPTVNEMLTNIFRVLKQSGTLYLTTPNNEYYKTNKLTFEEIRRAIIGIFPDCKISFFNTHKRIGNNRKLNLANVIPKISSKFHNTDKIINNLIKESDEEISSVSFFVYAKK